MAPDDLPPRPMAGAGGHGLYASIVDHGNAYFRAVLDIEKFKYNGRAEIIEGLNRLLRDFIAGAALPLDAEIDFCDVHALMQRRSHTELCFVQLNGRSCRLLFHDRLFEFKDPFAGFIFVGKIWVFLMVLAAFVADHPGVVAEFTFELGDVATLDQVSFSSTNPKACLVLDFDFASTKGYAPYRAACREVPVPWEDRHDSVFWRGVTTGRRAFAPPAEGEPDDLSWLPRLRLAQLARQGELAGRCDIGITDIVQVPEPHLAERIRRSGLMAPRVPREAFMQARAVIDIDGNANAWSGLFCSLLGGSCVLKIASFQGFRQWYYDRLTPWLHVVPVRADFSDLAERVRWVGRHGDHARQIAARGRELAESIDLTSAVRDSVDNLHAWLRARA